MGKFFQFKSRSEIICNRLFKNVQGVSYFQNKYLFHSSPESSVKQQVLTPWSMVN